MAESTGSCSKSGCSKSCSKSKRAAPKDESRSSVPTSATAAASVSELTDSLSKLTMGQLKSKHRREAKQLKQEWDTKLKRSKGSGKRQVKREMKIRQSELIERHKKEESTWKRLSKRQHSSAEPTVKSPTTDSLLKKTAERRRKAAARTQLSAERREAELREVEAKAYESSESESCEDMRDTEIREFREMLSPLGLRVYSIPADGHCLFQALSHQLELVLSRQISAARLRTLASTHMRAHKAKYLPFAINLDTDSVMTDSEFEIYCTGIAGMSEASESELTEVVWGGHKEIMALCDVLGVAVTVHQLNDSSIMFKEEGADSHSLHSKSTKMLHVSFHQHLFTTGPHYNSVVPL